MILIICCSLCHSLTHECSSSPRPLFSHDSFPMCPLQLNLRVPHLRQTGQGRRASAEAISHAWMLLCGSVDVVKIPKHCDANNCRLQGTHTNTRRHTNSQLSMKRRSFCRLFPFQFLPFHMVSLSLLSLSYPVPLLSLSLLSLIAILAHKLTHYSNSYSGRGKGLLINGGRCPVSAEQLWFTVVCFLRLHELLA